MIMAIRVSLRVPLIGESPFSDFPLIRLVSRGARTLRFHLSGEALRGIPPREGSIYMKNQESIAYGFNPAIQLLTFWFVVLVFIQTGSGGGGAANVAIGTIAILRLYGIPVTLAALFVHNWWCLNNSRRLVWNGDSVFRTTTFRTSREID